MLTSKLGARKASIISLTKIKNNAVSLFSGTNKIIAIHSINIATKTISIQVTSRINLVYQLNNSFLLIIALVFFQNRHLVLFCRILQYSHPLFLLYNPSKAYNYTRRCDSRRTFDLPEFRLPSIFSFSHFHTPFNSPHRVNNFPL